MHTCFDCAIVYGFTSESDGYDFILPETFLRRIGVASFATSVSRGYMGQVVYGIAVQMDSVTGALTISDANMATVMHAHAQTVDRCNASESMSADYQLGYHVVIMGDYEVSHQIDWSIDHESDNDDADESGNSGDSEDESEEEGDGEKDDGSDDGSDDECVV